ncbi:hypothetical protein ACIF9R_13790 [Streptomyces sp. NPDC086080]|uniref:hypothetical protein n=1 Tax=Streptomyces sp. NPDC086080 TaxID=3365748 RepID=UPI0037CE5B42
MISTSARRAKRPGQAPGVPQPVDVPGVTCESGPLIGYTTRRDAIVDGQALAQRHDKTGQSRGVGAGHEVTLLLRSGQPLRELALEDRPVIGQELGDTAV